MPLVRLRVRPAGNEADADPRFDWDSNAVLSETWQIFRPGTSGMLAKIPRSSLFCQERSGVGREAIGRSEQAAVPAANPEVAA